MTIIAPTAPTATPAPTHATIAADTRARRQAAGKYEKRRQLDAALKRYCADRLAAIANDTKLPNFADYA